MAILVTISPAAAEETIEQITRFLKRTLEETARSGFVIGLSGGIDSALAATLAVRAVGSHRVYGVLMPYRTSSAASKTDAGELAQWLEIKSRVIDISPMIDAYFQGEPADRVRAGNKMARERMSILFDIAQEQHALVLGTGNRTEIALGYTTLYGDSACSLNPIGQLYKTEVRALAAHLNLPESIRVKPPSADLWEGQTDEDELEMQYDEIDRALVRMVDQGVVSRSQLTSEGFSPLILDKLVRLLNANAFKRRLPPIAQIGKGDLPASFLLLD